MYRERSRSPVGKVGHRRDNFNKMNVSDNDLNNGSMNNSAMGMTGIPPGMNQGMNMAQGINMNQMQMMNNMYQQGNMLMNAMYPNMMMGASMMGGMPQGGPLIPQGSGIIPQGSGIIPQGSGSLMPSTGMDMLQSSSMDMMNQPNMEMMNQSNMDMGSMQSQSGQQPQATSMDMMPGMIMDPSMMGMNMYTNMSPAMDTSIENALPRLELKEIVLKNVTLTPPSPDRPIPPRRIKPPGCRTIFVGGLPDKIRESMVRDVFERYGRIITLRLSKKNFCHIRFDRESCVDEAMNLSGYNIKITEKSSKDDKDETRDESSHAYSGWVHVDYALSRDDQNEYERRQRQALRAQEEEMQKMQQMSSSHSNMGSHNSTNPRKSRFRSPSPPRVVPFSSTTVTQIAEKLKTEDQFATVLPTLLSWLERGECSKKNSSQFYSMIQVANSHIRRLFTEKMQAEDEFQEYKERMKINIGKIIEQLEQVGKLFNAATHQRVWDHFTKPQRKNIETWQKMSQRNPDQESEVVFKNSREVLQNWEFTNLKEEFLEKFGEDDVAPPPKPVHENQDELMELKRENGSLQFQLEAYKNEVDVIKAEAHQEMEKFKAQYIASQALKSARENPPLPSTPIERPPPPPPLPTDVKPSVQCGEAKLIGVMASFLQVHPQGASLDYVVSYVRALFPSVMHAQVHQVLQKHTDAFELRTTGVGANIDNRWHFTAFHNIN